MAFLGRFFEPPAASYYLFGPRGTGKSAWTQRRYPDGVRIDLLHPATLQRYRARPERLFEAVRAQPDRQVIVIDEVQRVPALLSAVHALIEERRGWRFVLTGSSARKLRRSGVDLMAGRAVVRTMHPFMAAELGDSFHLPAALRRGMLPLVLGAEDPADTLQSYVAVYVREEVQMEGLVRDLDRFSRFLETVSFSPRATPQRQQHRPRQRRGPQGGGGVPGRSGGPAAQLPRTGVPQARRARHGRARQALSV